MFIYVEGKIFFSSKSTYHFWHSTYIYVSNFLGKDGLYG